MAPAVGQGINRGLSYRALGRGESFFAGAAAVW
jgi:hypothetical protein